MMGTARYLRHSHFNALQVFEQRKRSVPDRVLGRCSCDLPELLRLGLKKKQQHAAGVKSSAARMSLPACQELICATLFKDFKCHPHYLVSDSKIWNLKGVRCHHFA